MSVHALLSTTLAGRAIATAALVAAIAAPTLAQTPAVFYRLFLTDGTSVVSYGEYTRVGDQVVFSLPIGPASGEPRLQLTTLPAGTVDWEKTDRYTQSARFTHYLETRAESDFALMTSQVARVLNEIALTPDRARRLQIAEYARSTLVEYPRSNYGYRVDDIRQMVAMLDEVVADLRAAAGGPRFDLSFVAVTDLPPVVPMLPRPTLQETIEQALTVSTRSASPIERVSLLQAVLESIGEHDALLPPEWKDRLRTTAQTSLSRELETERGYRDLTRQTLAAAERRAAAADVRGVEAAMRLAVERDEALGKARPDEMRALTTALEAHLDAARRLRLGRDRWNAQVGEYRRYERAMRRPLETLSGVAPWLADIKALAGPDPRSIERLQRRVYDALIVLAAIHAPEDLRSVHRVVESALQFAQQAATLRQKAVADTDVRAAWDASSAAAAAMMMLARARDGIAQALAPPQLK